MVVNNYDLFDSYLCENVADEDDYPFIDIFNDDAIFINSNELILSDDSVCNSPAEIDLNEELVYNSSVEINLNGELGRLLEATEAYAGIVDSYPVSNVSNALCNVENDIITTNECSTLDDQIDRNYGFQSDEVFKPLLGDMSLPLPYEIQHLQSEPAIPYTFVTDSMRNKGMQSNKKKSAVNRAVAEIHKVIIRGSKMTYLGKSRIPKNCMKPGKPKLSSKRYGLATKNIISKPRSTTTSKYKSLNLMNEGLGNLIYPTKKEAIRVKNPTKPAMSYDVDLPLYSGNNYNNLPIVEEESYSVNKDSKWKSESQYISANNLILKHQENSSRFSPGSIVDVSVPLLMLNKFDFDEKVKEEKNQQERNRRGEALRQRIKLKNLIPGIKGMRKVSKLEILRSAQSYCLSLQREASEVETLCQREHVKNVLWKRLLERYQNPNPDEMDNDVKRIILKRMLSAL